MRGAMACQLSRLIGGILQQNFACVERTLENASDREAVFLLCRADERCSTDIQAANKERGLG